MDRRTKAFTDLFELINLYSVSRDQPTIDNFFELLDENCKILDLDCTEIKKTFGLKDWKEFIRGE